MSAGVARIFVPAHVTGFFSVHDSTDPLAAGSRGAGLTLTDGATVRVERAERFSLAVGGQPAEIAPVERVMRAFDVTPRIDVETDVPIGAGFGLSGAISLGAAIGLNRVYGRERSENELVRIAHAAEVQSGTGLGDVVAQHRGGVPIRLEPGAPGEGTLDGIPETATIEYISFGELSTADILSGDTGAIDRAGASALDAIRARPTLAEFVRVSRRFSRESGLETPEIRTVIDDVEAHGGQAAMAMLGQTVFALGSGLSDSGYDAARCEIASGSIHID